MNKDKSIKDEYVMRLNAITKYIDEHIHENLDLAKLAEMSNFSNYHFHRIFKEYHKETLAAYISRNRVERAAYLLSYTNSSIREIAYSVGFEFPSSLSKSFKQSYKVTPSEYRFTKRLSILEKKKNKEETIDASDIIYSGFVILGKKNILYCRLTGAYNRLRYPAIWRRLLHYAKEQNIDTDKSEFLILYHNDIYITETSKLRLDVCITVNKPIPAKGKIGAKEIRGGKYAAFGYKGPCAGYSDIYDMVFQQWALQGQYELKDLPIFEKYLNNPMNTKPDRLNMEIYLPVQ